MQPTTFGRIDETLRSFGFTVQINDKRRPPARVYKHEPSGALIFLPVVDFSREPQPMHLVGIRVTLESYGVAAGAEFDRRLATAG